MKEFTTEFYCGCITAGLGWSLFTFFIEWLLIRAISFLTLTTEWNTSYQPQHSQSIRAIWLFVPLSRFNKTKYCLGSVFLLLYTERELKEIKLK